MTLMLDDASAIASNQRLRPRELRARPSVAAAHGAELVDAHAGARHGRCRDLWELAETYTAAASGRQPPTRSKCECNSIRQQIFGVEVGTLRRPIASSVHFLVGKLLQL